MLGLNLHGSDPLHLQGVLTVLTLRRRDVGKEEPTAPGLPCRDPPTGLEAHFSLLSATHLTVLFSS